MSAILAGSDEKLCEPEVPGNLGCAMMRDIEGGLLSLMLYKMSLVDFDSQGSCPQESDMSSMWSPGCWPGLGAAVGCLKYLDKGVLPPPSDHANAKLVDLMSHDKRVRLLTATTRNKR